MCIYVRVFAHVIPRQVFAGKIYVLLQRIYTLNIEWTFMCA